MSLAVLRERSAPAYGGTAPSSATVPLSEADLVRLWEGQRFPPQALVGRDGLPLRVVFRGRPCAGGPGPDFRDAVIATASGQELRGDVELHVLASAFRQHGHHLDPAYDNVALHVVFWDDGGDTVLASGRRAPVVALAPWVAQRAEELSRWLCQPALWQEPCRTASQRLGAEAIAATLDGAGDRRLQEKAVAFRAALAEEDAEEVLYQGLLEALGYSQNREPFRRLARALPWRELQRTIRGAPPSGRAVTIRRRLADAAEGLPWQASSLRPANHPQRRLAGLAHLAERFAEGGLLAGLLALVRSVEGDPTPLLRGLQVQEKGQALIGPERAGEMAVNVVLPLALAWAEREGDEPLARAALALYQRHPRLSSYGILRTLCAALGPRPGRARRQQGMLYLFHRYCRQGGCGECPLS